jgi:TP901 family phage tail tape measure protein
MNNLRLQVILSAVDKLTAPFRSGITASRKLAEATKAAKDNLKNLESQAASIEQFKSLARTAAITGNELASAKSKTKALAQQIQQTTAPSKALLREFEQAKNKVRELKDREQSLTAQQQRLRQSMQSSGIDVRNLSSEQRRLRQATTDASRALEQQKQKLAALAEQQRRMSAARAAYDRTRATQGAMASTGAGLMATGAAVGALTLKPVVDYAQAEDAATGLKVSMMGAGGVVHKEFAAISDLATKLGNQLPGTTADFQNMMSTLIQQGMSAKSILGGLGQATAYLGVQMKMPYDQAAQFAAKLQDATGTAEKDMMGLMDTIQRSYYLGVDSSNMLGAFTNLSPALSILRKKGLEASQVLAPLIVMADQAGMSGDAAGNAYRKIFQMSMDAGNVADANKGALKGTGIALQFSDGKGEFAGLDNLFTQLAKMRKLTTEQRLETLKGIYGDDAETLQALNLMIDKGQDGYNETIKKMKAQADLQSRVNTQLGTLKNLWDAATGTFTNALVAFGEAVAPEIKTLVIWIGELSERLGAWAKANPEPANRLMKTAAAIAVVTAAAGGLALAAAAILGPFAMLRFALSSIGIRAALFRVATTNAAESVSLLTRYGQLNTRMSAGLLGKWQTLGNVGLAGKLRTVGQALAGIPRKLWGMTKALAGLPVKLLRLGATQFTGLIGGLKQATTATIMYVQANGALGSVLNVTKAGLAQFAALLRGGVVGALRLLGNTMFAIGRLMLANPLGILITAIAVGALLIYKYWEPIKAFFSGVWQGLREGLAPVAAAFTPAFNALGDALSPLKPIWDGIVSVLKTVWDWFGKLFEPIHSTRQELESATNMGKRFGEGLANAILFAIDVVTAPLKLLTNTIQWIMDGINWLNNTNIPGAANHAQAIGNNPALASGYLTGNYGPAATAGGFNYVTGGYTPAEAKPYQPVRMSSQTTVVDNTLHAPITVHAAPGIDEAKVGQMVEAKLQAAQQRQAARSRARLGDRD